MPVTFWVGLGLVILLIYLGKQSTTILGISAALLLFYLYAIPTLVNENGIEFASASYFLNGEGLLLAKNGHLITDATTHMSRYHDWPVFLYLTAILSQITGITSFAIPHYFPILSATLIGLFSFIILRTGLETKLAIFGAMWVLTSNFQPHLAFLPQGMGILFTLPIFFLHAREHRAGLPSVPTRVTILLLFLVQVATHGFSSLATIFAIASIFILGIFFTGRRRLEFTMPTILLLIFLAYTLYVSISPIFELGVRTIYATITGWGGQTPTQPLFRFGVAASPYYDWTLILSYAILALNVFIGGAAILYTLVRGKSSRSKYVFWVGWLAGLLLAGSTASASEGYLRAFSLGIIPVGYLCVSLLARRQKVLLAILAFLALFNIPAHYGNLTGTQRTVTSADLVARNAYAQYAPVEATYFYQTAQHSWAADPVRAISPVLVLGFPPTSPVEEPVIGGWEGKPPEEVVLKEAIYIIDSDLEREEFKYFIGYDFLERLNLDSWGDLWYNDGYVRIYRASAGKPGEGQPIIAP